jgi:hypothetical protein
MLLLMQVVIAHHVELDKKLKNKYLLIHTATINWSHRCNIIRSRSRFG